jgi:hypothetical protein
MTCDVARNRLLALPDPTRPTDDLLPHLTGCAACRTVQAEAVRLDALLRQLPVPAAARMETFLNELEADGPVIRTRPVVPSTLTGSGAFKPVTKWLKRVEWKYVGGGVAAAVVLGLGIWLLAPRPKGQEPEQAEKPRSERLARMVKHTNELATTARQPHERMGVYADWTADLKGEAVDVYKVADRDDMTALANQYERVVSEGVVGQARLIEAGQMTPGERQQVLTDAMKKLADAETDASRLAAEAPPNARDALGKIARTAQDGRRTLAIIAEGDPKKGTQP